MLDIKTSKLYNNDRTTHTLFLEDEPMSAPASAPRPSRHDLAVAVLWAVSFLATRAFLDHDLQRRLQLAGWIRFLVALVPVIPAALFLRAVIRGISRMDELHRRVHLEALVIAYPLAILLLMTLGLLQLAVDLPVEDWSYRHVWIYLPLFYFGGLALAWRRYR
jgi:hypothetical protein